MVTEKGKSLEKVKENGQRVTTRPEQCMEEIQAVLDKYNCQIICIPQNVYGQRVYVPMIEEIKK